MPAQIETNPTRGSAWAESATSGDIVNLTDSEIAQGWPSTDVPPSRQRFNFIQNYLWKAARYLTQRGGIAEWDENENYPIRAVCLASDGNFYRALQANQAQDPVSTIGYWEQWAISQQQLNDAAASFIPISQKGTANGVATLDSNGLVPSNQLPIGSTTVNGTFKLGDPNSTGITKNGLDQLTASGNFFNSFTTAPSLVNWSPNNPSLSNIDRPNPFYRITGIGGSPSTSFDVVILEFWAYFDSWATGTNNASLSFKLDPTYNFELSTDRPNTIEAYLSKSTYSLSNGQFDPKEQLWGPTKSAYVAGPSGGHMWNITFGSTPPSIGAGSIYTKAFLTNG